MERAPVPDDVRIARAIRALRDTLVGCGIACLGLGAIALALVALAPASADVGWPTITLLGGGQLLALIGAGLSAVALRSALAGRPTDTLLRRTWGQLRLLAKAVLVWCLGAAAAWTIAHPSTALLSLALAAVTAQLAVLLLVLSRRLTR